MTIAAQSESFRCKLRSYHSFNRLWISFPHFHHNFAMFSFDSQIWMNSYKKIIKTLTSYVSFVNNTSIKVFSFFCNNFFPIANAKKLLKPFHYGNIDRSKFQNCSMNNRKFTCFSFNCIDVETPISVDISSKISKIQFFHVNSFATVYINGNSESTVNDLASGIRKDMRKSDLATKAQERNPKRFLRLRYIVGHISNRLPVLNSAAARLGQAARETQDVLQRDNLETTASIVNCVGGSNGDLPTEMALSDVDDIVATLQDNDAEYITNMIPGELKIGTSPIGDAYGCMLTTRMIPVLNNIQGFVRKFQYPNVDNVLSSEWGGVNNVRFFVSSQGSVSPNASILGNDVANCFVAAKESYKVVKMLDHYKSSLIDLEAYDYAMAA